MKLLEMDILYDMNIIILIFKLYFYNKLYIFL